MRHPDTLVDLFDGFGYRRVSGERLGAALARDYNRDPEHVHRQMMDFLDGHSFGMYRDGALVGTARKA